MEHFLCWLLLVWLTIYKIKHTELLFMFSVKILNGFIFKLVYSKIWKTCLHDTKQHFKELETQKILFRWVLSPSK